MENNKIKKSVKFQGDTLNFYDFIQVFVFTTNHHLNRHVLTNTKPYINFTCYNNSLYIYKIQGNPPSIQKQGQVVSSYRYRRKACKSYTNSDIVKTEE